MIAIPFTEPDSQGAIEIYDWVSRTLIANREDGNANRASAAPGCVRKRWYKNQGLKGEALQPRSALVFLLGDLVEYAMKYLISQACVGQGKLYKEVDFGKKTGEFILQHRNFDVYQQESLQIRVPGVPEITAHPDGFGLRNSDSKWEIIEIKSSADFGFDRFSQGETPDYIRQVHTIMMSPKAKELGADSARFFYMRKNTSHICDRLYQYDPKIAYQVAEEFKASNARTIPDRPFTGTQETFRKKPTGREVLGFPCTYCEYVGECQPEFQRIFEKGKPVYVKECAA